MIGTRVKTAAGAATLPFPPFRETNWRVVPLDGVEVVTMAPGAHRFVVEDGPSGQPVGLVRADIAGLASLAPEMFRTLGQFADFLDKTEANLDRVGFHAEAQIIHNQASEVRALLARAGVEA